MSLSRLCRGHWKGTVPGPSGQYSLDTHRDLQIQTRVLPNSPAEVLTCPHPATAGVSLKSFIWAAETGDLSGGPSKVLKWGSVKAGGYVSLLALPLTADATLGKVLSLPGPQFPHL